LSTVTVVFYTYSFILFQLIAEVAELLVGVAPVLIDLDEGLEEDALAEESLQVAARLGGNLLESLALTADDDALLLIALHVDDGIDVD
jgi:hypothetical protein